MSNMITTSAASDYVLEQMILPSISEIILFMNITEDGTLTVNKFNQAGADYFQLSGDKDDIITEQGLPSELVRALVERGQYALEHSEVSQTFQIEFGNSQLIDGTLFMLDDEKQFMLIATDQKERVRHEQESRQYDEMIEALLDGSEDAIVIQDMNGTIEKVNNCFENVFGWVEADIVGQGLPFIPEFLKEELLMIMVKARLGERIDRFETKLQRKNGSRIDVSMTINPVNHTNIIVTISDKSYEKDLEKRLEKNEALYQMITENSRDLISVISLDGVVTYASPSYKQVLGFSASAIEGHWYYNLIHKDDLPGFHKQLLALVTGQASLKYEMRIRHAQGHWIWIEVEGALASFYENHKQVVISGRDIRERKHLESKLTQMAYHDPLTELPNVRLLHDRIEVALTQAVGLEQMIAVVALDCDKFKQINDTMGHDVGDELLKGIARRLQQSVRANDTVARIGGDEFILLIPGLETKDEALEVVEACMEELKKTWQIGEHSFKTTSSMGVSYYPTDGTKVKQLIKNADLALYEAKKNPEMNYQVFAEIK
ncbi:diguanylate cyclase domain-containing protein [Desertibacillus haloalkaliphilus]|uniref:diguanylate cyclase domain-containing protein n=1 Tax=Desertibacillus haloalkaliphilus TaxID=1328930 RepID=UPI001C25D608|nr:diguanylate cyclase [Desertibacillus haloalkaliphilus]MBU8904993.1 diguanylate cyclase [Desertibacillus haloalkaliphilus]